MCCIYLEGVRKGFKGGTGGCTSCQMKQTDVLTKYERIKNTYKKKQENPHEHVI